MDHLAWKTLYSSLQTIWVTTVIIDIFNIKSLTILAAITLFSCSSNRSSDKPTEIKKNASPSWMGTWNRHLWQNDGTLEIKDIKNDSIHFTLFANSGGHTGELEGDASVTDNTAIFSTRDASDSCYIEFSLMGDSIIRVDQKTGICSAGMGVVYSGEYKNGKLNPVAKQDESLFNLGIFENENQDSIFKSLVGDSYSLFVSSTQLTSEDDDLDSLHATVHSSGVRGLFTSMENIVMIDSSNNIWAAVIDDDKVYYFTNKDEYKNRIPKTIENWRQRFKSYKIVYK